MPSKTNNSQILRQAKQSRMVRDRKASKPMLLAGTALLIKNGLLLMLIKLQKIAQRDSMSNSVSISTDLSTLGPDFL